MFDVWRAVEDTAADARASYFNSTLSEASPAAQAIRNPRHRDCRGFPRFLNGDCKNVRVKQPLWATIRKIVAHNLRIRSSLTQRSV